MHAVVHAADLRDRDGGVLVMATLFGLYPLLLKLYADSGYTGPKIQAGLSRVFRQINVEIVKRMDAAKFVVLAKRWIVEHAIAWPNRLQVLDDFLAHLRSLPGIWNPTGAECAAHWLEAYPASSCLRLEKSIWQDHEDSLS